MCNLAVYFGRRYGTDKEFFLRNTDIFVFPTYYSNECFPLVLIEAMQQGLPCISTVEGGIPSIIDNRKTGLLVKRQNTDDLADKIAWMIEHPKERSSMGLAGWHRYRKEFTLSAFESRFANILGKILKDD